MTGEIDRDEVSAEISRLEDAVRALLDEDRSPLPHPLIWIESARGRSRLNGDSGLVARSQVAEVEAAGFGRCAFRGASPGVADENVDAGRRLP